MTSITNHIVERLNLKPTGSVMIIGVGGSYESDTYCVNMRIDSTNFKRLDVSVGDYELVLIGRDLIRQWWFKIDGCNETFTIEPCSSGSNSVS